MMRGILLILAALAFASPAHAHTRSQSMSHWQVDGRTVIGRVEVETVDVTRLYALGSAAPLEEVFLRHAGASFALASAGSACTLAAPPRPTPAAPGRAAAVLRYVCPADLPPLLLESSLFLAVAPTHLHFVTVSGAAGAVDEAVLTDSRRSANFELRPQATVQDAGATFLRYVPVGAAHVWGGLDHLAFIVALVLLARRLGAIALAATGFTLGHTATLGLAAFGVLQPHPGTVEALIGFTVAFVAIEAGTDGRARLRAWSAPIAFGLTALAALAFAGVIGLAAPALLGLALFAWAWPRGAPTGAAVWLAAAFGLIHGCGFAGALGELDLPRPRLLAALGGFNVGVELAQIAVIAAALVAGWGWRRFAGPRGGWAQDALATGLLALGLYWFAARAFG